MATDPFYDILPNLHTSYNKQDEMILRRAYAGDSNFINNLSEADFRRNVDNILFGASYGLYADTPDARNQYRSIVMKAIPLVSKDVLEFSATKAAAGGQFEIVQLLVAAGARNFSDILYWVGHAYEANKTGIANENAKERAVKSTTSEERMQIQKFARDNGGTTRR